MLYEAAINQQRSWHVVSVTGDPADAKRSPRVSVEWAQNLIDRYGRDHPYVLVNVLGQFPPASFNTLVSIDDIREAQSRNYAEPDIRDSIPGFSASTWRYAATTSSVIWPRQGLVLIQSHAVPQHRAHLGGRLGCAEVDRLGRQRGIRRQHRRLWRGVDFFTSGSCSGSLSASVSRKAPNDEQFFSKRAEIGFLGAQWIKDGGKLPPASVPGMAELTAALTQTTYTTRRDELILEPKELIKEADRLLLGRCGCLLPDVLAPGCTAAGQHHAAGAPPRTGMVPAPLWRADGYTG